MPNVYAKYERQTDDDQGDTEKKQSICIRHVCISRTTFGSNRSCDWMPKAAERLCQQLEILLINS